MDEETSRKEMIQSLYDLYANDIYRYAWTTLGDSLDAKDVVQEVFLRACRSWHTFRHDANAKTWLMRIARNYIFDVFRKKRTERKYMSDQELSERVDTSSSMDIVVEVTEALHVLKDEYCHVIVLRYIENLSVEETAAVLGWSPKKVRNTTHRALTKLREVLGSHSEEVDIPHEVRTRNS